MKEKPIRILLIEHNPADAMLIRQRLSESPETHFEVIGVDSLSQAKLAFDRKEFHAILLDLRTPDKPGLDGVAFVQSEMPPLPMIVLAKPDDEPLAIKAVQAGAHDYLLKRHVSPDLLVRSVRYAVDRHQLMMELRAAALVDELTGLHNRQGFLKLAQQQMKISARAKRSMLLVLAGVDGLKRINDRFGRYQGDLALGEVSSILKRTFRLSDIVSRYRGDEFAVLAIETGEDSETLFTARLKENVDAYNQRDDRPYKLSISIGIAAYDPESETTLDDLLERAEEMLVERKRAHQHERSQHP